MNEIELAKEVDRLDRSFNRALGGAQLYPPGRTTRRERELMAAELKRRGHRRLAIVEGTITISPTGRAS